MIRRDEADPAIRPADQTVPGLRAAVRMAQEMGARLGERQILFGPMPHAQTRILGTDADAFGRLNVDTSPGCGRLCSPMDQPKPASATTVEEIPIQGSERTRLRAEYRRHRYPTRTRTWICPKNRSTWLSHDAEVGVK